MRNSYIGVFTLVLAFYGCNNSEIDPTEQAALDAYLALKRVAQSNKGDAVLYRNGKAVTLTIADESSPLQGAEVVVPPNAFREKYVVVTLQPTAMGSDKWELQPIGPGALLTAVQAPVGAVVEPIVPLELKLPFDIDNPGPPESIGIGQLDASGRYEHIEGSATVENTRFATSRITNTGSYSASWVFFPMFKSLVVEPLSAPANYRVLGADGGILCAGAVDKDSVVSFTTASIFTGVTTSTAPSDEFRTRLQLGKEKFVLTAVGDFLIPAADSNYALSLHNEFSEVVASCNGKSYVGVPNLTAGNTLLDFTTTQEVSTKSCGSTCSKVIFDMEGVIMFSTTTEAGQMVDVVVLGVSLPGVEVEIENLE